MVTEAGVAPASSLRPEARQPDVSHLGVAAVPHARSSWRSSSVFVTGVRDMSLEIAVGPPAILRAVSGSEVVVSLPTRQYACMLAV